MVKRKYSSGYKKRSRKRYTPRSARTFMAARKKFPSKDFGYRFQARDEETYQRYGPTYSLAHPTQRHHREMDSYYGKGKYGFLKKAWNVAKPLVGMGLKYGAKKYLGQGIYTGQGSYDSNSNELVGESNSDMIPRFAQSMDETGSLTITHREYVGEIYANEENKTFENRSYPLNPGMEQTFPWLSQIAANFEEYDLNQLMFTFRSTVADVSSANGQVGTVMMATNYNPSSRLFRDKGEMLEYTAANSAKVTEGISHGVECDNEKLSGSAEKYIRTSALERSNDIKEYDHGIFQLATANTPVAFNNNSIGELWVSYTVMLRKPRVFTGRGSAITRCILHGDINTGMVRGANGVPDDHRRMFGESTAKEPELPSYMTIASKSSFRPKIVQSATTDSIKIILPGNLAGIFKFDYWAKGGLNQESRAGIALPHLGGNIKPHYSVYGGGPTPANNAVNDTDPSWYIRSGIAGPVDVNASARLTFYCEVAPASNNVDNVLWWGDWSDVDFRDGLGLKQYYTGQKLGPSINNDNKFWEDKHATINGPPSGTFSLTAVHFEISEVGSGFDQSLDKQHAQLEYVKTGMVVDATTP